jgi:hypothetical protein
MEPIEEIIPHLFVCTVNYNNINGLKRTISSYRHIPTSLSHSIIFIDGGSEDGSAEIIKNQKYAYIIEKDYGTYDAMNKGIDWVYRNIKSKNSYLIFMNSGDEFSENIDFLSQDLTEKSSDILVYKNKTDKGALDKRYKISLLDYGFMPVCHQAVIYSVSRIAISDMKFSLKTWSYNDFRQIYTLYKKGKVIDYLPSVLSVYEQTTTSGLSRSNWRFRFEKLNIVYSISGYKGIIRMLCFKILSKCIKVEI